MEPVTCESEHENVPVKDFEALPRSQKVKWRHACAACAYELGRKHGLAVEARLRARIRELEAQLAGVRRQTA